MRVVLYNRVWPNGYKEMGIWVGSIFSGEEPHFRDYACDWIVQDGPEHISTLHEDNTRIDGWHLLVVKRYSQAASGSAVHEELSRRYRVHVEGYCVEYCVRWLDTL